jgi:hypothetical protein
MWGTRDFVHLDYRPRFQLVNDMHLFTRNDIRLTGFQCRTSLLAATKYYLTEDIRNYKQSTYSRDKRNLWSLLLQHGHILLRHATAEQTQRSLISHKLDNRFLRQGRRSEPTPWSFIITPFMLTCSSLAGQRPIKGQGAFVRFPSRIKNNFCLWRIYALSI